MITDNTFVVAIFCVLLSLNYCYPAASYRLVNARKLHGSSKTTASAFCDFCRLKSIRIDLIYVCVANMRHSSQDRP